MTFSTVITQIALNKFTVAFVLTNNPPRQLTLLVSLKNLNPPYLETESDFPV